jgi:hypothetical protein
MSHEGCRKIKSCSRVTCASYCPGVIAADLGAGKEPNIVMLMTDDTGWNDLHEFDVRQADSAVEYIMKLGFQPVNIAAQFYANPTRHANTSPWGMRLQFVLLFPKLT